MPEDIVERLKREKLERQQKRNEELAKYEKDLAERREQRRAGRAAVVEKERQSDTLISNSTKKSIEESFKKIEISSIGEDLKKREFQSKQRDVHSKISTEREAFNRRRDNLKLLEKRRGRKRGQSRPKRFVMQPAEFYGIDFSAQAHVSNREQELFELSQAREDALLQNPEKLDMIYRDGNMFVKALFESTSVDRNAIRSLVRKRRLGDVEGSMSSIAEEDSDSIKKGVDDFARSLNDLTSPDVAEEDVAELSSKTKVKWTDAIKRPQVDQSDFFPPTIGMQEGISVFRIEEMKPVSIQNDDASFGFFCVGDCYIVLNTYVADDGRLDWLIYQWVGDEASLDKKACSAIFSVGLRNLLGTEHDVVRIQSSDTPVDFVNIFHAIDADYGIVDGAAATESGLFAVQEREYPLLVYKIQARSKMRKSNIEGLADKTSGDLNLELTTPSPLLFKSNQVYLIDNGLEIYQWNGSDSSLIEKMKCRLFGQRLVNSERPPGKAHFKEVEQNQEPNEFWKVFENIEVEEDDVNVQVQESTCRIYLFDDSNKEDFTKKMVYESRTGATKPSYSILKSDLCAVVDCEGEVYFWIGKNASARLRARTQEILIQDIFPSLSRPSYVSTNRIIEGTETEIFKSKFNWSVQSAVAVDFSRVSMLPELKSKEVNLKVDIKELFSKPWNGKNTVDEEAFYANLFTRANSLLRNFQAFIFDNSTRKFIRLPSWDIEGEDGEERGHLWSRECYVFLCVYEKQSVDHENEDANEGSRNNLDDDSSSKKVEFECVSYTWTGRHLPQPSFGFLTYQHQFKNIISDLISTMSKGSTKTHTVNLIQEKESLAFIAHLNREIVIHLGNRPSNESNHIFNDDSVGKINSTNPKNICMFHVRTDLKYKVTRAIEVCPMVTSLSTRNCYVIINRESPAEDCNFLWIGRGASKEEEKLAESVAKSIYQYFHPKSTCSFRTCKERTEPREFWQHMAPTFQRPSSMISLIPQGQGYYHSVPPPRLFRCTTEDGYFRVIDLGVSFTVSDLQSDSVCILDAGPGLGKPFKVWAWIGRSASDVVLKMSKKSVDAYFDHLQDGRSLDRSEWDNGERSTKDVRSKKSIIMADLSVVRESEEHVDFRAFFHGWGDVYAIGKELSLEPNTASNIVSYFQSFAAAPEPASNSFLRNLSHK